MAVVTTDVEGAAKLFRALGDETRLRLLQRLRAGAQCVCQLTDDLDASQSRLSFHLKILKDAGLVSDRRDGRWVYYAIKPQALATLERILTGLGGRGSGARPAGGGEPTRVGRGDDGRGSRAAS